LQGSPGGALGGLGETLGVVDLELSPKDNMGKHHNSRTSCENNSDHTRMDDDDERMAITLLS